MKNYKEIITIKGWLDGSGWQYDTVYDTHDETLDESGVEHYYDGASDAGWWDWFFEDVDPDNLPENEDLLVICSLYDEDDNLIAEVKKWQSEYFKA